MHAKTGAATGRPGQAKVQLLTGLQHNGNEHGARLATGTGACTETPRKAHNFKPASSFSERMIHSQQG